MNLNLEPLCGSAVASSAVLGVTDWNLVIDFSLFGLMFIGWLCALVIMIRVTAEIAREDEEDERKNKQAPSKKNNLISLLPYFFCRLCLFLCNKSQNLAHIFKLSANRLLSRLLPHSLKNRINLSIHEPKN